MKWLNVPQQVMGFLFQHRVWTLVAGLILMALGVYHYLHLPMEAYPDFTNPLVRVITLYPGKGAEEVERLITIPIEKELNGLKRQIQLRSVSMFGLSVVSVVFQDNTPSSVTRQQVLERIRQADVPADVKPALDPDATPIGEIFRYTLESSYYDKTSLKALQEWEMEKAFRQVPGVVDVTSFGGPRKTYQVQLDSAQLKSYDISVEDVMEAIAEANGSTGANTIDVNHQAFAVRALGLINNIEDFKHIGIKTNAETGTPIRLEDVATVNVAPALRLGQVGKNADGDAVMGIVLMRRGENPAKVLNTLYQVLPDIRDKLPKGVLMKPLYDRMELMRRTMETIGENVLHGIGLVLIVLLIFLGDWQAALICASVIPFSLLVSFSGLTFLDTPANLLSLGAIDFGMIVDGTVVMVEHLVHRLSQKGRDLSQKDRIALVQQSTLEMIRPITVATLVIGLGFIPIFGFTGVAGKLFHPLAITMNLALFGALLASLTLVPILVSFFMTKKPYKEGRNIVLDLLTKGYKRLLLSTLRYKKMVLWVTLLLMFLGLAVTTKLGSEFLPQLDEGNIWLRANILPTSAVLPQATKTADHIRRILAAYPEVKNIVTQVGSPDDGTDPNLPSNIQCLIDLYPAKRWRPQWHENKQALVTAMDQSLDEILGLQTMFSQYIQDNVDEALSGGAKAQVALKIFGSDLNTLQHVAQDVLEVFHHTKGMTDVSQDRILGQPQYRIELDRDALNRYGLSIDSVEETVQIAVGGQVITQVQEGERRFDVVLRLNPEDRSSQHALHTLLIQLPNGGSIPLHNVAHIKEDNGAYFINRFQNERVVNVVANVRGRDLGGAVQDAQKRFKQTVTLPEGYRVVWAGQYDKQQEANSKLMVVAPLTLVTIFLLLLLLFRNMGLSLIALSAIPIALVGGILSLWLTGTYFSVSAGVGFLAAAGVSVQNSIILISAVLQASESVTLMAIFKGAVEKLRPILMAGLVAILGLLPAALSNGIGAQSQKPFAIAIIGSLILSTVFLPLIIPALLLQFRSSLSRLPSAKTGVPPQ
ncbi:MAG: efflux RND transporter permease subunit [Vampirovibrio sp.]